MLLAATIIIVICVSAALAVYFLQNQPATGTVTIRSTMLTLTRTSVDSSTSTNNSMGLRLAMYANSTKIVSGQTLTVNISEYNALSIHNNVSASTNWPPQTASLALCNSVYPLRMGVVKGYYSSSNISSVQPTQVGQVIDPNIVYACPIFLAAAFYNFQPQSDNASWCVVSGRPACYSPVSHVNSFNSSWVGKNPSLGIPARQENFTPGSYTIIGGDEWGQLVLLHFLVFPSNNNTS
jgi:hypothetical protein